MRAPQATRDELLDWMAEHALPRYLEEPSGPGIQFPDNAVRVNDEHCIGRCAEQLPKLGVGEQGRGAIAGPNIPVDAGYRQVTTAADPAGAGGVGA